MNQILTELENILDALSNPAQLEGGELSLLNTKWVRAISHLKTYMSKNAPQAKKDIPKLRQRLERILARMPEIQELLLDHKSEVADQLYVENRRVQAIRQAGYNAMSKRTTLLHQRA